MKSSATVLIVGLTLVTSPAFAGRDQTQTLQQERAIEAYFAVVFAKDSYGGKQCASW
mgnify:CR=1 FL=1